MSNSVVPAAAAVHAKKLVKNGKLTKHTAEQKASPAEQQPADKDADEAHAVQAKEGQHVATSMSDVSLSGDFTFSSAHADAASGTASLVSVSAEEASLSDGGYGDDDGDGISGTLLLVGAVALVGLGVAVLAGGGNKNDPPAFASATQAVTTNEDTAKAVTVTATDPDKNDSISYTVTANPSKGTLTGSGGSYTYTPNANVNGSDSFTVTATDSKGATATQTVNITITPVNDVPTTAATQTLSTDEDTAVTGQITASDVDGDTLSYAVSTQGTLGTAAVSSSGAITYTPNADANGTDTFVLTVSDGNGGTATQTVTVNIAPVNDAPRPDAENTDSLTIAEDTSGPIVIAYTDVDGDDVTATLKTDVAHGTLSANADGTYTYTPDADFNGTDALVYTVSDGIVSFDHTVAITVTPVNDAPVFGADSGSITMDQDTTATATQAATDVDGDTLTYSVSGAAANGTASVNSSGTFSYTPNEGYVGSDSFTLKVDDGNGGTDTITYSVTVLSTNVAPDFGADSVSITVDQDGSFSGTVVATDDNDDPLTYALGDDAAHGTVIVDEDGNYSYTPDAGFFGTDSYTVTVEDGRGGSDELLVNVTVEPAIIEFSIDIGVPAQSPVLVDASGDDIVFTDNAAQDTNVDIVGFDEGDVIHVTGASADDYSFSSPGGGDLQIVFNNAAAGKVNIILIEDILGPGFVTDLDSAVAAAGFEFITFG